MTAEVAVMNRMAVALAADSTVTVTTGNAVKTHNSAIKLFMLSQHHPVGVMVYNNASLLGVPWETILKLFRRELGHTSFETLEEYGQALIHYLNGNRRLFPLKLQKSNYLRTLEAEYQQIESAARRQLVTRILDGQLGGGTEQEGHALECAESAIQDRVQFWREKATAVCFAETLSKEFVGSLSGEISDLVLRVFADWPINGELISLLRELAELRISKEYFHGDAFSGVVIAGFGEIEHFPSLQHFRVGGIYDNELKFEPPACTKIAEDAPSIVKAFAYTEMVDSFLNGITLPVLKHLAESTALIREMPVAAIDSIDNLSPEQQERLREKIRTASTDESAKFFSKVVETLEERKRGILQEVEGLGPSDLAQVASTLVSLSSFQQRMLPQRETVGGPVDVAVISKGDGFIWIERKHYFQRELNHHFFENYFRSLRDEEKDDGRRSNEQISNTDKEDA